MSTAIDDLKDQKYFSLESYRKNGQAVCTPLWFVEFDGKFYFFTAADAFKVKRIKHNPKVRFAACNVRGKVKGQWCDGHAYIVEGDIAKKVHTLMRQKYWLKRVMDFFNKLRKPKHTVICVRPD